MDYQIAFITLASINMARLVPFYQALLQQSPLPYIPNKYAEFQLESGLKIGIFQPREHHQPEFNQPHNSAISLCLEVVDLDSAIAQLICLGYPPRTQIINGSHGKELYTYDPDGNRLILHQSH